MKTNMKTLNEVQDDIRQMRYDNIKTLKMEKTLKERKIELLKLNIDHIDNCIRMTNDLIRLNQ
jgi:hypothetical protein